MFLKHAFAKKYTTRVLRVKLRVVPAWKPGDIVSPKQWLAALIWATNLIALVNFWPPPLLTPFLWQLEWSFQLLLVFVWIFILVYCLFSRVSQTSCKIQIPFDQIYFLGSSRPCVLCSLGINSEWYLCPFYVFIFFLLNTAHNFLTVCC